MFSGKKTGLLFMSILLSIECAATEEPYFGLSAGIAKGDFTKSQTEVGAGLMSLGFSSVSSEMDDVDTSMKLSLGVDVNPHFSIEAYYASLGEYKARIVTTGPSVVENIKLDISGIGFDAILRFPMSDRIGLFVQGGVVRAKNSYSISASSSGYVSSTAGAETSNETKIGGGLSILLTDKVSLHASYESYSLDDPIKTTSLGLHAKF